MKLDLGLLFFSGLSFGLPLLSRAQDAANPSATAVSCAFSCPEVDTVSAPLVKRPHTIGYDSYYSIFECVYGTHESKASEHKCSYYKTSGLQALGSVEDHCPSTAVPCSDEPDAKVPKFSNQESDEVPPWVEAGRYLLYLKEHQPHILESRQG